MPKFIDMYWISQEEDVNSQILDLFYDYARKTIVAPDMFFDSGLIAKLAEQLDSKSIRETERELIAKILTDSFFNAETKSIMVMNF